MMLQPLIGLTTTRSHNALGIPIFSTNAPYVKSISTAGGLPVLIPLDLSEQDLDALISRLHGVLFTGGGDINPRCYGSLPHPRVAGIDDGRDQVELHLVNQVIRMQKPFLGICRGIQVINVALGGSLYEDITEQYPGALQHDHHDMPRDHLAHPVEVEPQSHLAGVLATHQALVNSLHHQGIRNLAPVMLPVACAPDGLIEAFELPAHPFGMAVQWHPEELNDHAPMLRLFQAFVQSCLPVPVV